MECGVDIWTPRETHTRRIPFVSRLRVSTSWPRKNLTATITIQCFNQISESILCKSRHRAWAIGRWRLLTNKCPPFRVPAWFFEVCYHRDLCRRVCCVLLAHFPKWTGFNLKWKDFICRSSTPQLSMRHLPDELIKQHSQKSLLSRSMDLTKYRQSKVEPEPVKPIRVQSAGPEAWCPPTHSEAVTAWQEIQLSEVSWVSLWTTFQRKTPSTYFTFIRNFNLFFFCRGSRKSFWLL